MSDPTYARLSGSHHARATKIKSATVDLDDLGQVEILRTHNTITIVATTNAQRLVIIRDNGQHAVLTDREG